MNPTKHSVLYSLHRLYYYCIETYVECTEARVSWFLRSSHGWSYWYKQAQTQLLSILGIAILPSSSTSKVKSWHGLLWSLLAMVSADNLNLDVLELIFEFLSGNDLPSVAQVSRSFLAGVVPRLYRNVSYGLRQSKAYTTVRRVITTACLALIIFHSKRQCPHLHQYLHIHISLFMYDI